MKTDLNYDANKIKSLGLRGEYFQRVRLIFGRWEYRAEFTVDVGGNCTGLSVIESAIDKVFSGLPDANPNVHYSKLVLTDSSGNLLEIEDEDDMGEDWLQDLLLSAEITTVFKKGEEPGIEPANDDVFGSLHSELTELLRRDSEYGTDTTESTLRSWIIEKGDDYWNAVETLRMERDDLIRLKRWFGDYERAAPDVEECLRMLETMREASMGDTSYANLLARAFDVKEAYDRGDDIEDRLERMLNDRERSLITRVFMICNAYESGVGQGQRYTVDKAQELSQAYGNKDMREAFVLGVRQGNEMKAQGNRDE